MQLVNKEDMRDVRRLVKIIALKLEQENYPRLFQNIWNSCWLGCTPTILLIPWGCRNSRAHPYKLCIRRLVSHQTLLVNYFLLKVNRWFSVVCYQDEEFSFEKKPSDIT
jgi:hypothetical protein